MQTMAPPGENLEQSYARLDERIVTLDRRVAELAKERIGGSKKSIAG